MNTDNCLRKAEDLVRRINRTNWKERRVFLIKKAKDSRKELAKEFHKLQQEHCDNCESDYECPTCKPEFDKMRKAIEILGGCK